MIQFDINLESIFLDWMFQPSARFISVRFGGSSVQAADMIHILRCSYPSLSSAPRAKLRWKAGSCSCRCPKIFSSPSRPREHHNWKVLPCGWPKAQRITKIFNALGSGSKPDAEIEHVEAPMRISPPFIWTRDTREMTKSDVYSNYPLIFSRLSTFLEVFGQHVRTNI